MLVDNYEREDVFAPVPKLAQEIDPVLRKLDGLLDDDGVYQQVRVDFGKRHRYTLVHGRHSTPVEVLLRMLILKHLYQWSYKELEARVKDSLVLRWFCRVAFHAVPDASTLWRWEQTLRPETVHALVDRVAQLAKQARVTKGRKLRLDATCVQTTIHHPTDSGLLVDSVRVLSRVKGVIAQTRSRVLEGKKVASADKVLSLFEPHTRAIPRHKGGAQVEFGRQVILDEVEGGIVTRYQILEHPTEHGQAVEAVAHHQQLFEHPPNLVAGDRGVHSADTESRLQAAGVKLVAIPAVGKLSEERKAVEHTRRWKRGYRW